MPIITQLGLAYHWLYPVEQSIDIEQANSITRNQTTQGVSCDAEFRYLAPSFFQLLNLLLNLICDSLTPCIINVSEWKERLREEAEQTQIDAIICEAIRITFGYENMQVRIGFLYGIRQVRKVRGIPPESDSRSANCKNEAGLFHSGWK